jgi:peptidoglycan lytic transglycosylase
VTGAGRRRVVVCGAPLVSILLAACATSPPPREEPASDSAAQVPATPGALEPRSDRGNPPFYDVLGKRYHVLATSEGYHQRGVASWYGRDFHGLSTSSGEQYNMHAMTAAHTTLPLPTWVEVTNLANGKRVVVRVNDRGPFVDNRLIDLSYAAALELDMVRTGTTRVEVRALSNTSTARDGGSAAAPAAQVAAGSAATAPLVPVSAGGSGSPSEQMFVQVGAFGERENAERLVDRLKASGFANPVVVTEGAGRKTLHRVRLGPLRDAHEFDAVSGRLRTLGVADSHLVVDR